MPTSVNDIAFEYVPTSVNDIAVLMRDYLRLQPVVLISYTMTVPRVLDFRIFV